MASHFAGVFIHNFPRVISQIMVLCVQDRRYPDVKMPGGMSESVLGDVGRGETPEETMKREAISETGVQILQSKWVFRERRKNDYTRVVHERYFFLATKVSGLPDLISTPRAVTETNPSDKSIEKLVCYWLPLRVFADRLFNSQQLAFGAILAELAKNHQFCEEFGDLLEHFPEPENLGLEEERE